MTYQVQYSFPYEGTTVEFCDTIAEVLKMVDDIKKGHEWMRDPIEPRVYEIAREISLEELEKGS